MRFNRYIVLFVVALVMTLGLSTAALAGGKSEGMKLTKEERKRLKTEGILTLRSEPVAYPVRIDGKDAGMTGVGTGTRFWLTPGFHMVEVIGPDGKVAWSDEVEIRRGLNECICVKAIEKTEERACPYRFHLEAPASVKEGEEVVFTAVPDVSSPVPLRYSWRVSNGRILSGEGTPSIVVDSTGMGTRTIDAELDVNDDVYDNRCRQVINVPTEVTPREEPPPVSAVLCDDFEPGNRDQDKARFDNCVIKVQNTPDAIMYVVISPGTDRISRTRFTYAKTSKFYVDYMVRNRGMDPGRIRLVQGPPRTRTRVVVWTVPPGAQLPEIY